MLYIKDLVGDWVRLGDFSAMTYAPGTGLCARRDRRQMIQPPQVGGRSMSTYQPGPARPVAQTDQANQLEKCAASHPDIHKLI